MIYEQGDCIIFSQSEIEIGNKKKDSSGKKERKKDREILILNFLTFRKALNKTGIGCFLTQERKTSKRNNLALFQKRNH